MKKLLPVLLACVGCVSWAAAVTKPNVLLITADDLGLQLGCYGDKAVRTPHLDALAKRGRLFENAYVAQASCSPSRSAMFTGLYPHANGQYGLLNAGVGFELHEPLRARTIPALRRSIRDARFKLIHNLRAGQVKASSGMDGDAAFAMSQTGKFAGTPVGEAFARLADPPEFELYDLRTDPWEFTNLSAQAQHAATLRRLQDALLAWRRETDDPLLTTDGMSRMAARENAAASSQKSGPKKANSPKK